MKKKIVVAVAAGATLYGMATTSASANHLNEKGKLVSENNKIIKGFNVFEGKLYKDGQLYKGYKVIGKGAKQKLYYKGVLKKGFYEMNEKNVLFKDGKLAKGYKQMDGTARLYKNGYLSKGYYIFETDNGQTFLYYNGTLKKGYKTAQNQSLLFKNGLLSKGNEFYKNVLYIDGYKNQGVVEVDGLYYNGSELATGNIGGMTFEAGKDITIEDVQKLYDDLQSMTAIVNDFERLTTIKSNYYTLNKQLASSHQWFVLTTKAQYDATAKLDINQDAMNALQDYLDNKMSQQQFDILYGQYATQVKLTDLRQRALAGDVMTEISPILENASELYKRGDLSIENYVAIYEQLDQQFNFVQKTLTTQQKSESDDRAVVLRDLENISELTTKKLVKKSLQNNINFDNLNPSNLFGNKLTDKDHASSLLNVFSDTTFETDSSMIIPGIELFLNNKVTDSKKYQVSLNNKKYTLTAYFNKDFAQAPLKSKKAEKNFKKALADKYTVNTTDIDAEIKQIIQKSTLKNMDYKVIKGVGNSYEIIAWGNTTISTKEGKVQKLFYKKLTINLEKNAIALEEALKKLEKPFTAKNTKELTTQINQRINNKNIKVTLQDLKNGAYQVTLKADKNSRSKSILVPSTVPNELSIDTVAKYVPTSYSGIFDPTDNEGNIDPIITQYIEKDAKAALENLAITNVNLKADKKPNSADYTLTISNKNGTVKKDVKIEKKLQVAIPYLQFLHPIRIGLYTAGVIQLSDLEIKQAILYRKLLQLKTNLSLSYQVKSVKTEDRIKEVKALIEKELNNNLFNVIISQTKGTNNAVSYSVKLKSKTEEIVENEFSITVKGDKSANKAALEERLKHISNDYEIDAINLPQTTENKSILDKVDQNSELTNAERAMISKETAKAISNRLTANMSDTNFTVEVTNDFEVMLSDEYGNALMKKLNVSYTNKELLAFKEAIDKVKKEYEFSSKKPFEVNLLKQEIEKELDNKNITVTIKLSPFLPYIPKVLNSDFKMGERTINKNVNFALIDYDMVALDEAIKSLTKEYQFYKATDDLSVMRSALENEIKKEITNKDIKIDVSAYSNRVYLINTVIPIKLTVGDTSKEVRVSVENTYLNEKLYLNNLLKLIPDSITIYNEDDETKTIIDTLKKIDAMKDVQISYTNNEVTLTMPDYHTQSNTISKKITTSRKVDKDLLKLNELLKKVSDQYAVSDNEVNKNKVVTEMVKKDIADDSVAVVVEGSNVRLSLNGKSVEKNIVRKSLEEADASTLDNALKQIKDTYEIDDEADVQNELERLVIADINNSSIEVNASKQMITLSLRSQQKTKKIDVRIVPNKERQLLEEAYAKLKNSYEIEEDAEENVAVKSMIEKAISNTKIHVQVENKQVTLSLNNRTLTKSIDVTRKIDAEREALNQAIAKIKSQYTLPFNNGMFMMDLQNKIAKDVNDTSIIIMLMPLQVGNKMNVTLYKGNKNATKQVQVVIEEPPLPPIQPTDFTKQAAKQVSIQNLIIGPGLLDKASQEAALIAAVQQQIGPMYSIKVKSMKLTPNVHVSSVKQKSPIIANSRSYDVVFTISNNGYSTDTTVQNVVFTYDEVAIKALIEKLKSEVSVTEVKAMLAKIFDNKDLLNINDETLEAYTALTYPEYMKKYRIEDSLSEYVEINSRFSESFNAMKEVEETIAEKLENSSDLYGDYQLLEHNYNIELLDETTMDEDTRQLVTPVMNALLKQQLKDKELTLPTALQGYSLAVSDFEKTAKLHLSINSENVSSLEQAYNDLLTQTPNVKAALQLLSNQDKAIEEVVAENWTMLWIKELSTESAPFWDQVFTEGSFMIPTEPQSADFQVYLTALKKATLTAQQQKIVDSVFRAQTRKDLATYLNDLTPNLIPDP